MRAKIGIALSRLGIPANAWTAMILVPAFASLALLLAQQFVLAAVLFALAMVIDAVDGAVAHASRVVTPQGAFLDSAVASYAEAFALFGLMAAGLPALVVPAWAWASLLLFSSLSMEYFSALAKLKGLLESDWLHLYTKPTRMALLVIAMLGAAYAPGLATSLLAVTAVISLVAVFNRQAKALFG